MYMVSSYDIWHAHSLDAMKTYIVCTYMMLRSTRVTFCTWCHHLTSGIPIHWKSFTIFLHIIMMTAYFKATNKMMMTAH
jgi:hypothetical protein